MLGIFMAEQSGRERTYRDMSSPASKTRLETWKEVATYLGKDERTVRRYFEKAYLLLKQMLRP